MRVIALLSCGLAGAAVLAACNAYGRDPAMASTAGVGSRACFYAPHIRGFRQGPGDSIVVNTNSRNYFVLQPYHRCGNINTKLAIAIRTRGSNYVCEGYDADLYIPDVLGPHYCPVRAVRKLTPAEVTALRASRR